ncbi:MAG: ATP-binding protein [Candidatus Omnitrophica bacterium]|nr:ATP-binding protein [Candidatus Omnitrophota bacterium]
MAVVKNDLVTLGKEVETIPVELSYQIIKHFSAGLYTSPNKAVEELVANSYDAWATCVHVILPDNLASADATIWVVDNGESMDEVGFKDLWRIGESNKRDPGRESRERPPIGKFGIGKLATYVLAKELTYLCKKSGKCLAITMDFSKLEAEPGSKKVTLKVRHLSIAEAQRILAPILTSKEIEVIPLFGKDAPKTWTVAAMGQLTTMAQRLTPGRLKMVLRTALPINPQFNLYFNGEQLKAGKIDASLIQKWIIGKEDEVARALRFEVAAKKPPSIVVPSLGRIWGEVELFKDPVTGGKAEIWGRSHGFFVMVRGRLINLHDELFGLETLSHGTFSRFRMVVHADGLDDFLRATRESVAEDEEGVINLRLYLKEKFNEARSKYNTYISEEDAEKSLPKRISSVPRSLSRLPLQLAIKRFLTGDIKKFFLIKVPINLEDMEKEKFLIDLDEATQSDNFFKDVRFEALGLDQGMAIFDASERCFKVNIVHPFFANYCEHTRSHEAFQLLAVSEVLTEAYLLEEGLSTDQVHNIMYRRDRFLRELVFSTQLSAPLVANLLNENRSNPKGLEKAVHEGMKSLGFEITPLAKSGETDGIALARLGVRDEKSGQNENYTVTYDAKSTSGDKVSAKDVGAATIAQHRDDNKADFALVVAPRFDGDGEPESNAVKQAIVNKITLITLPDFITLILVASARPIGFSRLRDEFFEICRGPKDAHEWIEKILHGPLPETHLEDILETIWEMTFDCPDPIKFAAVRERLAAKNNKFKNIKEKEIKEIMESVRRFARDLITIIEDRVFLESTPEIILRHVVAEASRLPAIILKGSMYESFMPDKKELDRKAKIKK